MIAIGEHAIKSLPPYSPELSPIEETFSKIKQFKARTLDDILTVLKKAFSIITGNDTKGYFEHAAEC
ncbi:MAG: hypothetical protein QX199_02500 [Methylococcaceae bacterium]